MSDNARLSVVEERTERQQVIIDKLDNTITQIQIYAESSQKLLESHENALVKTHEREVEREQKNDDRHNQLQEKLHAAELDRMKRQTEDREIIRDAITAAVSAHSATMDTKLAKVTTDDAARELRIRKMEVLAIKLSVITGAITFVASIVLPTLFKMWVS